MHGGKYLHSHIVPLGEGLLCTRISSSNAKPKKPVLIIKPKKNRKTGKPPKPILVVLLMMQLHQEIVLLVKGDFTVQRLV